MWIDGSAKWGTKTGWVAGYGATILGEWEDCGPLAPEMKHTINRAELMAVIVVVKQFGTLNRRIAVAMDSEYVYSGLQGAAARWKQNGWVSATGPVSNADLWIQLTSLLESSCTVFHWIKIPSHTGLRGNDVADDLANKGRLMASLYSIRSHHRHVGMAIRTPTSPRPVAVRSPVARRAPPPPPPEMQQPAATPVAFLFDTPGSNLH